MELLSNEAVEPKASISEYPGISGQDISSEIISLNPLQSV